MATLYQYLAICTTKSMCLGEKLRRQKIKIHVLQIMILTEVKPSSTDLRTLGKANQIAALGTLSMVPSIYHRRTKWRYRTLRQVSTIPLWCSQDPIKKQVCVPNISFSLFQTTSLCCCVLQHHRCPSTASLPLSLDRHHLSTLSRRCTPWHTIASLHAAAPSKCHCTTAHHRAVTRLCLKHIVVELTVEKVDSVTAPVMVDSQ